MTDKELMQQALDAMLNNPDDISDEMFESIKALKERLAQAKQEIVSTPSQRQWKGLTEKEAMEAVRVFRQENEGGFLVDFARAIETKLKEKNHA